MNVWVTAWLGRTCQENPPHHRVVGHKEHSGKATTSENLEESEHVHIDDGMTITADCPLGRIQNHPGDKPLGLFVLESLDCINFGGKILFICV